MTNPYIAGGDGGEGKGAQELARLEAQLIRHEGKRLKMYRCPAGKWTIGVGHNIEDRGLSSAVVDMILREDIAEAVTDLMKVFDTHTLDSMAPARSSALVNMMFNLGLKRFKGFKNTIEAVNQGDYERASKEMKNSLWARQVGDRADELAEQMRTGQWR